MNLTPSTKCYHPNFFFKGPRDTFKAIDTLFGALAQFLHIFTGQKQEKCNFQKK
jgi:hypothetical protein